MHLTKIDRYIAVISLVIVALIVGVGAWYNQTYKPYRNAFTGCSPSKLVYKTEHDFTVVTGNEVCLVYNRYNEISFAADVVVCEIIGKD